MLIALNKILINGKTINQGEEFSCSDKDRKYLLKQGAVKEVKSKTYAPPKQIKGKQNG